MSFDLNLLPMIITFSVVALATLAVLVAAVVDTAVRNRPVRLARHETVTHYYGHLVLGH